MLAVSQEQPREEFAPAKPARILLCAATKWEALPLAKAFGLKQITPGVFERADNRITLVKMGIGPDNAAKKLREWRQAARPEGRPSIAVSTGFAGALQPDMNTGDIVADLRGCESAWAHAARETAQRLKLGLHFGKVVHCGVVLACPADKAALGREQRASAVDMETSAVRDFARTAGIPSFCIRVVLDSVDQPLPDTMPEGEDFISLARYAMANARQLPLLAAVGLKQRASAASLCLFLKAYLEAL